jgi:predicted ATPase
VLDAALLIAELLATAGAPRLLITSRERLHLRGEKEVAVPPLALPDRADLPPLDQLSQYAAVALFRARALDTRPDFRLTNANATAVAEICARLDGLPLAIELAAARIKLFAPEGLLLRLGQRLQVLTGGPRDSPERQQTLRNTIDWSYKLLDESEQALFWRLGVFVGGCTLEAAEAVCRGWELRGGSWGSDATAPTAISQPATPILEGFKALVDKSLLRRMESSDSEPRFVMLETVREYVLERLEASGETDLLRQWHAGYFVALTEAAEPHIIGTDQAAWLNRLEAEHDNLRAALEWLLKHREVEAGLRLAGVLWIFWNVRGYRSEGRRWLEEALERSEGATTAMRAKALNGAGGLAYSQGDYAQATALYEQSLALWQELGDLQGRARVFNNLVVNHSDYDG